jgi:hypothetical protein
MEQVPKIVQQRLRATAKPGAHPDPNVLTAFAEKSLGEQERGQVMGHLAECAGCREVVSVAGAANEGSPEISAVPARSRWLSWPLLRWGAAVACVVIVGSAVTLHYEWRSQPGARLELAPVPPPEPSSVLKLEDKASNKPEEKLAAKIPPPSPIPTSNLQIAGKLAKPRPGGQVGRSVAVPSAMNGVLDADQLQKQQVAVNQLSQGELTRDKLGSMDAGQAEARRSAVQGQLAAAAPAAPSVARSPATKPPAKERNDEKGNTVASTSETVTVMAEAVQVQTSQAAVAKTKDKSRKKAQNGRAEELTGMALGGGKADMKSAEVASGQYKKVAHAGNESVARWTIAADGALQQSFDAGRTWQAVPVAPNVVFRALSSNESEIWVGGNAGALYHSSDAGQHWRQIKPQADGRALTGDIVTVEFGDPQHGKLTTSNRETWTTSDGGQSWRVE